MMTAVLLLSGGALAAGPAPDDGTGRTEPSLEQTPAIRTSVSTLTPRGFGTVRYGHIRTGVAWPTPEALAAPQYGDRLIVRRPHGKGNTIARVPYDPGRTLLQRPAESRAVRFYTTTYVVDNEVYYRSVERAADVVYKVVDPPVGALVNLLPAGYWPMTVDGQQYYVYNDTYYEQRIGRTQHAYRVVDVPMGGVILNLPRDAQPSDIGPKRYFQVGRAFYWPCFFNGRTAFMRVEP